MNPSRTLVTIGFGIASVACSDGGAGDNPTAIEASEPGEARGDSDSSGTVCDNEDRAEEFSMGMSKETDDGLRVALVDADPAPPARNDNTWVFSAEDADGEPIVGAQLLLDAQMPDHGHGSPREAIITELGQGRYEAEPVALFMPGYWAIDVSLSQGDESLGSVHFDFCVP